MGALNREKVEDVILRTGQDRHQRAAQTDRRSGRREPDARAEHMRQHLRRIRPARTAFATIAALLVLGTTTVVTQHGAKSGQWHAWAGDPGSTRYAPLDQINASNFSKLQVAWRFKTDAFGVRPDYNLQTTPLMVNGVLYFTAGSHRNAVAVNAATGEMF